MRRENFELQNTDMQQESWRIFRIIGEFVEGFETMSYYKNAVTIFGSARTKEEHPHYKAAYETAKLLAKNKYYIINDAQKINLKIQLKCLNSVVV